MPDQAAVKIIIAGEGPEAEKIRRSFDDAGFSLAFSPVEQLAEAVREPGLAAAEIVAPPDARFSAAEVCLQAGLFTSVEPPSSAGELTELISLARGHKTPLRVRMLPLYYPPYRELKRLVDNDAVGRPQTLKLMVKRGKGTQIPDPLNPAAWVREHEIGFLALAPWLLGPVEAVQSRLEPISTGGVPASSVIGWRHRGRHQYGYLQLDFCPGLHIRTDDEPVARAIELTGVGGIIFVNRGEGRLMRRPAIEIRGKTTTTAFENLADGWNEVYVELARETVLVIAGKARPAESPELALAALSIIDGKI